MKKNRQTGLLICTAALTTVALCCVAIRIPPALGGDAALAAAGFILPGGAAQAAREGFDEPGESQAASSSPPPASSSPAVSAPPAPPAPSESPAAPDGTVETVVHDNIKEMSIGNAGTRLGAVWVKNSNKNHGIDIEAELNRQPAVKIKKDGSPQVLIYHTHTTEAFAGVTRTQDNAQNVVAVGEEIASQLRAAGIGVIHDTTCHDYPSYNGSYDRSGETIERNLREHPTIQVTLDVHRDAMGGSDGIRIKPTAVVEGRKAAQIMIISGCDDNGTLGFPDWEYNLRLAVRIQKSVAESYPGLARPLNFCNRKYNEHYTKGSLLVEFGTEVNTLDEVKYAGQLFGKALAEALEQLT